MTNTNAVLGTATVMCSLATALGSWLIMGALGVTHWRTMDPFLLVFVVGGLGTIQLLSLFALASSAVELWPRTAAAGVTSAILGFGATAVCAILGSAWGHHPFTGVFWSLAGVYLGLAVEGVTGVSGRVGAAWAATAVASSSSSSSQDSGAMVARARRDE